VLSEHSKNLGNARRAYRRFVEQAIDVPPTSPLKEAAGGVFLGRTAWVDAMRERLAEEPGDRNVPLRKRLAWHPSPADILRTVRRHYGVRTTVFSEVRRHNNEARVAAIYLVRRLTDQKVTALAEQFGAVSAPAISKVILRAESRRNEDPKWNRLLGKLEKQCTSQPKSKS